MTTSAPGFLLLHGWQNRRPADHWQHLLADELRGRGLAVRYPQLPSPDEPDSQSGRRRSGRSTPPSAPAR